MNKNAKTIVPVVVISILLLLIIVPYIIYGIFVAVDNNKVITGEDILKAVEKNWEISIPDSGKVEYGYMSPDRWFGEGERYIYITFEEEPTEFLKDFTKTASGDFKESFDNVLQHIEGEIAVKGVIDWSDDYYFKTIGEYTSLKMVYFPEGKKLYVLESII